MIPPLLLSVFGGGVDQRAFLYALLICGGVGVLLSLIRADNARLQTRDGFVCVALCWIALSVFGALPYFFQRQLQLYRRHFRDRLRPDDDRRVHLPVACVAAAGHPILARAHAVDGRHGYPRFDAGAAAQAQRGQRVNLMKAESPGPISTKLRPPHG